MARAAAKMAGSEVLKKTAIVAVIMVVAAVASYYLAYNYSGFAPEKMEPEVASMPSPGQSAGIPALGEEWTGRLTGKAVSSFICLDGTDGYYNEEATIRLTVPVPGMSALLDNLEVEELGGTFSNVETGVEAVGFGCAPPPSVFSSVTGETSVRATVVGFSQIQVGSDSVLIPAIFRLPAGSHSLNSKLIMLDIENAADTIITGSWNARSDPESVVYAGGEFILERSSGSSLEPVINFAPNVDESSVSAHTISVLKDILRAAGEGSATITSTVRSPYDQARVMYDNLERHGVENQTNLYGSGSYGDMVIDIYVESKGSGGTRDEIISDMQTKIEELGPTNVSKHASDPNVLGVIDIDIKSLSNQERFKGVVNGFKSKGTVSKFLFPPKDPAFHLEIPQPKSANNGA